MSPETELTMLALELLGIEGLPSGRDDLYDRDEKEALHDPYLDDGQYQKLAILVAKHVPGATIETWRNSNVKQRVTLLREVQSALNTESESPSKPAPAASKSTKKNINARMLEKIHADSQSGKECFGWTCSQWAKYLKCSKPSVVDCAAWKELAEHRSLLKAERAIDRRHWKKPKAR